VVVGDGPEELAEPGAVVGVERAAQLVLVVLRRPVGHPEHARRERRALDQRQQDGHRGAGRVTSGGSPGFLRVGVAHPMTPCTSYR
jgi:hypothetical protein